MYMNNIDFANPLSNPLSNLGRAALPLYHADTINHCSSCGHSHWHIGRSTAQCAFCDNAIPLASGSFPAVMGLMPMREIASL